MSGFFNKLNKLKKLLHRFGIYSFMNFKLSAPFSV